jgi:CheY-like chemotaxis protein
MAGPSRRANDKRGKKKESAPDTQPALRHRVLVCEDDKMIAELLAATVSAQGHEVLVCHDGTAAIAQAEKWRPTAAIIDIGLPGVTGYGVAQHIRSLSRRLASGPQVLLIAITGYDSAADIEMARYAGFNWHFAKPARPSLLAEVLVNPRRKPVGQRDGTPLDR